MLRVGHCKRVHVSDCGRGRTRFGLFDDCEARLACRSGRGFAIAPHSRLQYGLLWVATRFWLPALDIDGISRNEPWFIRNYVSTEAECCLLDSAQSSARIVFLDAVFPD